MIGKLWTYSRKHRDRKRPRRNSQSRTWAGDSVSYMFHTCPISIERSLSGYGCLDHFLEGKYGKFGSFTLALIRWRRGHYFTLMGSARQDPILRCDNEHSLWYRHVSTFLLPRGDLSRHSNTGPSCIRMWSTIVVSLLTTNEYSSFARKCG